MLKTQGQSRNSVNRLIGGGLIILILVGIFLWIGISLFGTPDSPQPFPAYPGSTQLEVIQPKLYAICLDGIFGGRNLKAYDISKIDTPVLDFYREIAGNRGLREFSGQYFVQEDTPSPKEKAKALPQTCFKGEHRWHLEAANVVAIIDMENPDQLSFAKTYLKEIPQNTITIVFVTEGIISNI